MSHQADVIHLVLHFLDDTITSGWDLGDQLVSEYLYQVIELIYHQTRFVTYLLNRRARLDIPLLNSGFFGSLTQVG